MVHTQAQVALVGVAVAVMTLWAQELGCITIEGKGLTRCTIPILTGAQLSEWFRV